MNDVVFCCVVVLFCACCVLCFWCVCEIFRSIKLRGVIKYVCFCNGFCDRNGWSRSGAIYCVVMARRAEFAVFWAKIMIALSTCFAEHACS